MSQKNSNLGWKFSVGLAVMLSLSASATTIYDNSVNDLSTRFNPGTLQVGDEINLAGTERFLTNFSFEFYGLATGVNFAGTPQGQLRFYLNDGPTFNGFPTPGTVLYTSGLFPMVKTPRLTYVFEAGADFPVGGLFLPSSTITWSVQFSGLGVGDEVGVDLYNPPIVGSSFPDYWENNGAIWQLKTNIAGPMNFASKLQAQVPEPSTLVFLALGGLGFLCAGWRSRKA